MLFFFAIIITIIIAVDVPLVGFKYFSPYIYPRSGVASLEGLACTSPFFKPRSASLIQCASFSFAVNLSVERH